MSWECQQNKKTYTQNAHFQVTAVESHWNILNKKTSSLNIGSCHFASKHKTLSILKILRSQCLSEYHDITILSFTIHRTVLCTSSSGFFL